jgi:hypothetical protein
MTMASGLQLLAQLGGGPEGDGAVEGGEAVEVGVERGRLDVKTIGHGGEADGAWALMLGQIDGGGEDCLTVQTDPARHGSSMRGEGQDLILTLKLFDSKEIATSLRQVAESV